MSSPCRKMECDLCGGMLCQRILIVRGAIVSGNRKDIAVAISRWRPLVSYQRKEQNYLKHHIEFFGDGHDFFVELTAGFEFDLGLPQFGTCVFRGIPASIAASSTLLLNILACKEHDRPCRKCPFSILRRRVCPKCPMSVETNTDYFLETVVDRLGDRCHH